MAKTTKPKKPITPAFLRKIGVPHVLIPGIVIASVLGWHGTTALRNAKDYYEIKQIFPKKAKVIQVIDGDTIEIEIGMKVRMIGIDAPGRGQDQYKQAIAYTSQLLMNKQVTLEYDTYQDDKFGRILAYIWIPCTQDIQQYCENDKALANEILVKEGIAKTMIYKDRKKLKYIERLKAPITEKADSQ